MKFIVDIQAVYKNETELQAEPQTIIDYLTDCMAENSLCQARDGVTDLEFVGVTVVPA